MPESQGMAVAMEFAQKAVIFDRSGHVLLVARVTDEGDFIRWELPGGRVKLHEDLDEGFMREVWEEVGLDIVAGRPVHLWTWRTDAGGQIIAVARIAEAKPGIVTDAYRVPDDNLGETRWFAIQQVDELPMDDAYKEAIRYALSSQECT